MSLHKVSSQLDEHSLTLAKIKSLAEAVQNESDQYNTTNGYRCYLSDKHERILNLLAILVDIAGAAREDLESIYDDVLAFSKEQKGKSEGAENG